MVYAFYLGDERLSSQLQFFSILKLPSWAGFIVGITILLAGRKNPLLISRQSARSKVVYYFFELQSAMSISKLIRIISTKISCISASDLYAKQWSCNYVENILCKTASLKKINDSVVSFHFPHFQFLMQKKPIPKQYRFTSLFIGAHLSNHRELSLCVCKTMWILNSEKKASKLFEVNHK